MSESTPNTMTMESEYDQFTVTDVTDGTVRGLIGEQPAVRFVGVGTYVPDRLVVGIQKVRGPIGNIDAAPSITMEFEDDGPSRADVGNADDIAIYADSGEYAGVTDERSIQMNDIWKQEQEVLGDHVAVSIVGKSLIPLDGVTKEDVV